MLLLMIIFYTFKKVKGDKAIMLLNIDNILTDDALAKFQDNKHIICAKVISL